MKEYWIEENGYYSLRMRTEAVSEEDAIDKLCGAMPSFIKLSTGQREIEILENLDNFAYKDEFRKAIDLADTSFKEKEYGV